MDGTRVGWDRVVVSVFRGDSERESPPDVAFAGTPTAKCVTAAGLTLTAVLLPVIELLVALVAVIVWLPAVFSVMLNVPVPPVSVALAGKTAARSLLENFTVPV